MVGEQRAGAPQYSRAGRGSDARRGDLDRFAGAGIQRPAWGDAAVGAPIRARPPPAAGNTLVQLEKTLFHTLLEEADHDGTTTRRKEDTPFYRIQLEVAARAIIEGLRTTHWKLRPAARRLGISPTKLRYELKEFLEQTLARTEQDYEKAATLAAIPLEVFQKKVKDLGIDS